MYHEWLCVAEAGGPAQLHVCARGMSAIWFLYVVPSYINIPTSAFALIPASFPVRVLVPAILHAAEAVGLWAVVWSKIGAHRQIPASWTHGAEEHALFFFFFSRRLKSSYAAELLNFTAFFFQPQVWIAYS